jgi:hypothetical protein
VHWIDWRNVLFAFLEVFGICSLEWTNSCIMICSITISTTRIPWNSVATKMRGRVVDASRVRAFTEMLSPMCLPEFSSVDRGNVMRIVSRELLAPLDLDLGGGSQGDWGIVHVVRGLLWTQKCWGK